MNELEEFKNQIPNSINNKKPKNLSSFGQLN